MSAPVDAPVRPMKLAQIVPSLETRHGGPSVSVPALARALASIGHEVDLLSTGPSNRAPELTPGLKVEIFPRGRPEMLSPSSALRTRLATLEADVLHHHGLWLRPLHYVHRRVKSSGARLVISPRGMMAPWAWQHRRWKKILADTLVHPGALHDAHGWHATSEEEAADIRALGFRQPVCVAPNGVMAPTPQSLERANRHWRAACPEAFTRPTALFYARLHQKKRVIELIDLWLERAPRDWLLLVVGIPQTYSVPQLSDYVQRASGADRVRVFDGGSGPPPYVAASVYLLPSHSENFGLTVAEALAHGLPSVVTDTTPWRAMAASGNGWCVPWADFGATLSTALAEGPDRLRERGARAQSWVVTEYSWEKSARKLEEFYAALKSTT